MAKPIKETPVIKGNDARRFSQKMRHVTPVSKEAKEEAKRIYEQFKQITSFSL